MSIGILETIYIGLFFGFMALFLGYVLVKFEKDKPKGKGLDFDNLNAELPLWELPGFHIIMAVAALLLMATPFVIAILVGAMTTTAIWYLVTMELWPFISVVFLVMIHQGIIWNMINPNPKFGVKNLWNNYKESGEIPKVIFLTLVSLALAIWEGIATQWLIIFIVMMVITSLTVIWRSGKEREVSIT